MGEANPPNGLQPPPSDALFRADDTPDPRDPLYASTPCPTDTFPVPSDTPPVDLHRLACPTRPRWLDTTDVPKPTSWAGVLKRGTPSAPPSRDARPAFVPLSARPALSSPSTRDDCARTSFRRWKWEAASLSPSAIVPQLALRAPSLPPPSRDAPPVRGTLYALPPRAAAADTEAELLALMPRIASARPAAAAAAAAFRALTPYLAEEDRAVLRARFANVPPMEVLADVLEAAKRASVRYEGSMNPFQGEVRETRKTVWGSGGLWGAEERGGQTGFGPLLQVPGPLAAVWRREPGEGDGGWGGCEMTGKGNTVQVKTGGGLDVHAAPFCMSKRAPGKF